MPKHRTIDLFGPKAIKERVSLMINYLVDVPVSVNDGVSECICEKCKQKVDSLERAAERGFQVSG